MSAPATVLLVEDSQDDEELCQVALRRAGLAVDLRVARDGEEALAYLLGPSAASQPLPRLVLLDVKMPKVDGLEVLRRLRAEERTRRVPVVMLSSSDVPEDIRSAYRLGANSYVKKPVEFAAYADAIGLLGRYWLSLSEWLE